MKSSFALLLYFYFCPGSAFLFVSKGRHHAASTIKNRGVTLTSFRNEKTYQFVPTLVTRMRDKDDGNNGDGPPPFLATAVTITAILAAWPLLSFLRDTNNPTDGFDVDMFMALKGMLENNSANNMIDDYDTIVELPALTPAEQLVGLFFRPP
jgi:hypothetical protein